MNLIMQVVEAIDELRAMEQCCRSLIWQWWGTGRGKQVTEETEVVTVAHRRATEWRGEHPSQLQHCAPAPAQLSGLCPEATAGAVSQPGLETSDHAHHLPKLWGSEVE